MPLKGPDAWGNYFKGPGEDNGELKMEWDILLMFCLFANHLFC